MCSLKLNHQSPGDAIHVMYVTRDAIHVMHVTCESIRVHVLHESPYNFLPEKRSQRISLFLTDLDLIL